MAQSTITINQAPVGELSPEQQLSAVSLPHLVEQLRRVFENFESALLNSGESVTTACELRRSRRMFIDGFVRQWALRCESPELSLGVGSAANAAHTRTFIYLSRADAVVREIYLQQAVDIGRLSAGWSQFVGTPINPINCPLAPQTLAQLFFLFLPELPAPIRIRQGLALEFLQQLPIISQLLQKATFAFWQRLGLAVHNMTPLPLPESWELLGKYKTPSVASQGLVVPVRSQARIVSVADEIARAALAGDMNDVLSLVAAYRQTAVLPWLSVLLGEGQLSPYAGEVLALLAGPLVMASTDEHFADVAHPARRVLEEFLQWAPGWVAEQADDVAAFGVADQCLHFARTLASTMVQGESDGDLDTDPAVWLDLLDYLLALRKRSQLEGSVAVASARLSIQVLEVRAEVDRLLRNRAGFEGLPRVIVEILSETWAALLMAIHWREGTASDAWLSAIALADELLLSVQPSQSKELHMRAMQRVPHLLQQLRRGFDAVNVDRPIYSACLDRLEQVHLAVMQGKPSPEESVYWPDPVILPIQDDAFTAGQWLQEECGARWRVVFSDELCTVLIDTDVGGVLCCATAVLQAQFLNGELAVLPVPGALLPVVIS